MLFSSSRYQAQEPTWGSLSGQVTGLEPTPVSFQK